MSSWAPMAPLSTCARSSLLPPLPRGRRLLLRRPPHASVSVSAPPMRCHRRLRRLHPLRSSQSPSPSQGIPAELMEEGSKFVPLNEEDPMYGPPALLLIGFAADETEQIRKFLKELDGEFLKVIHCTDEMTKQTVWDAMHTEQPNLEAVKIAEAQPRICIFSGLTGEEMMMFIDAFPQTGLEPAAFAALVPNSAEKILGEVIDEIMGDHEMLTGKKSE